MNTTQGRGRNLEGWRICRFYVPEKKFCGHPSIFHCFSSRFLNLLVFVIIFDIFHQHPKKGAWFICRVVVRHQIMVRTPKKFFSDIFGIKTKKKFWFRKKSFLGNIFFFGWVFFFQIFHFFRAVMAHIWAITAQNSTEFWKFRCLKITKSLFWRGKKKVTWTKLLIWKNFQVPFLRF